MRFILHKKSNQMVCDILERPLLNFSEIMYCWRLSWLLGYDKNGKSGPFLPYEVFKTVLISKLHLEPKLQQLHRQINHDTAVNRNRRGVTLHSGEPSKMWCRGLITALDLISWCLAASRLRTPAQHHTVWWHVLTFCSSVQPSVGRALREHLPG